MRREDPYSEEIALMLAERVRHYLITILARLPEKAHPVEIFQAVSYALRERIIVNWIATRKTVYEKKMRRVYYLSMEYLPGRMLAHNISNLHANALLLRVSHLCGFDLKSIINQEPDLGLGNGGLGRLASCLMESFATQRYPVWGYGLRYQYGIFEQQIWDGIQVESPDCWLLHENPWGLRHDHAAQNVMFAGIYHPEADDSEKIGKLTDCEMVRAISFDFPIIGFSNNLDFNVNTLRLWSTNESPRNFQLQRYNAGHIGAAAENTTLTDVLYPNDNHEMGKRTRLKQEFLLVSASLQDIVERHFTVYGQIQNLSEMVRIHINDTHPALVIPELIRILITHYNFKFDEAWEATQKVVSYTNHTILPEAMEEWNEERMQSLLPRQHRIIEILNHRFLKKVESVYPNDPSKIERLSIFYRGQVRMAHVVIAGSHCVNGVAALHGKILKERIFKDFVPIYPEKFTYVTNGVTQRHWIYQSNPLLSQLFTDLLGDKWVTNFSLVRQLSNFAHDREVQKRFLEIKRKNKERLIEFIAKECKRHNMQGEVLSECAKISFESLFDVQVKRFHEYKRQLMCALHVIMIYFELLDNPQSRAINRTVIFAGKAAAGYTVAKSVIHLIYLMGRKINQDTRIGDKLKVIFLENYSVTKGEYIIPAADLSEQISTAGMEASGTGNMKLAMNGALTIGTEDGANIEMRQSIGNIWWPFSFGARVEELQQISASYHPTDIYSVELKIRRAVDALRDNTFAENLHERESLSILYDNLLSGYNGQRPDPYYVLYDLMAYYKTQKRVEELYLGDSWAEYALQNIAGMSPFSSDVAASQYAEKIWDVKPAPVDHHILNEVQQIYNPKQNLIFT